MGQQRLRQERESVDVTARSQSSSTSGESSVLMEVGAVKLEAGAKEN